MSELTFRSATNKDSAEIAELIKSVLTEFGLAYSPDTTDMDLTDIEKNYSRNGGIFEVIENENREIIGTVALYRINDSTCMLRKMYLDKKYRNLGLGKKLLERTLRVAGECNFKEIILETNTGMIAAIRLYEKFEFRKVENLEDTSSRCNLTMKKDLSVKT
jgi:putative acetyltransferase